MASNTYNTYYTFRIFDGSPSYTNKNRWGGVLRPMYEPMNSFCMRLHSWRVTLPSQGMTSKFQVRKKPSRWSDTVYTEGFLSKVPPTSILHVSTNVPAAGPIFTPVFPHRLQQHGRMLPLCPCVSLVQNYAAWLHYTQRTESAKLFL